METISRRKFLEVAGTAGLSAAIPSALLGCSDGTAGSGTETIAPSSNVEASASNAGADAFVTSSASSTETPGASQATGATEENLESTPAEETEGVESASENNTSASDSLVLIYSRADENYNVGYIETGNTMVLAQFIQQKIGADLFELKPATPYPADYQTCIDQALAEQDRGDRPAIAQLPDLSGYSTIYFGFPVWWGDIPMPVYTAIEALDWQDKTIAPFNTHEGSGSAGMFNTLAVVCEGSTVLEGLTVQGSTAQNQRDVTEQRVDEWLSNLAL
ncbi:MAG: hypothetical protein IJ131_05560 [Eggerthellaceae bacterium]|nr:hypothetical protein [Eggerthellaceae bacterium]